MELTHLEKDVQRIMEELESYSDEYKKMKHQDSDKLCEAIYRGKSEAYLFAAKKIRNLMNWHGLIKN